MGDPTFEGFLRRAVFEEILPTVPQDDAEKIEYAEEVFQRFRSPCLRHELLSISLNSAAKWRTRILPSLLDSLRCTGRMPRALAFSLAALACFYRGERRDGSRYLVRDDPAVLGFFDNAWAAHRAGESSENLATSLLAAPAFCDADLNPIPGLAAAVAAGIDAILAHGMRRAVAAVAYEETT